jgi:hypothetical protein
MNAQKRMGMVCALRRRAGMARNPDCWCNSCSCRKYYHRKRGYSIWRGMTSEQLGGPPNRIRSWWPKIFEKAEVDGVYIAGQAWSETEFGNALQKAKDRKRRKQILTQQPQLLAQAA